MSKTIVDATGEDPDARALAELEPSAEARAAHREPGFVERGRIEFLTMIREASRYRDIQRTPYGMRPILVFTLLSAVLAIDGSVFALARPEIIRDLDLNLVGLEGVLAIIGFFLIFATLGMSFLMDRLPRIPFVAIGTVLNGIASLVAASAHSIGRLGGAVVIGDVGGEALDIPTASLQADYYPPEVRGKVFALRGVIARILGGSSPVIVGGLATWTSLKWRLPYLITGPLLIVTGIAVFFLLKEPIRGYMERRALGATEEVARIEEEAPSFGEAWRTIWAIRTLRRLFISDIPGNAGDYTFGLFFNILLFEKYGLSIGQRGILFAVIAFVALPFGFLAGGLVDVLIRRRPQRVLMLSGLLAVFSSFASLGIAFAPPLWVIYGIYIVFRCASALVGPARRVLFIQILPAHVRTLGANVSILAGIPATLARFLAIAWVVNRYGTRGGLYVAFPFLLVAGLLELSAAGFFERDMRSSLASQLAGAEWRRALESGTGKMLVCRNIDVEYDGVQVLFGVDFDVEEGQLIALLGTNGAGKSTLLKAIAGIREASAGAVVFNGRDTTHMPPQEIARRGVILMPGGKGVFPGLTVRENLRLGNWMTEDDAAAEAGLEEVFAIFPVLRTRLNEPAGVLSGGEQQMLSLSQAFLTKPKLLMIDELSLGLSPAVVGQLLDIVRRIHASGTTIILVEQSVNVALTVADRAVFMEKGQVRFTGPTADLLQRPDILRAVYVKGTGSLVEGAPAGAQKTERERRVYELEHARPVLQVKEVSKSFGGIKAVDGVSLDLRDGEVLGLIGPNGAGKTTLFDLISGYQIPDEGSVLLDGVDVARMGADERARRKLVRRFQDAKLFPSLSVYENILVALEGKLEVRSVTLTAMQLPQVRQAERRVRRRAERLIELLELGGYRDKFVKELSTGLRRITDIACVLAAEPRILLLDEPSSGIAQAEAESLGPLLRRVRFEIGCSILIIEHDMPLISSVSDELIAMVQGQVVVRGVPETVLNDERVVQAYLGTSEDVIQRSGARPAGKTRST